MILPDILLGPVGPVAVGLQKDVAQPVVQVVRPQPRAQIQYVDGPPGDVPLKRADITNRLTIVDGEVGPLIQSVATGQLRPGEQGRIHLVNFS